MKIDCQLPIADCRLLKEGGVRPPCSSTVNRKSQIAKAFTLIELLVVIAILGLLAALVVPAIKDIGKSNVTVSATRQLLDDVGRARQLAMANHRTVYMVFVPTNFWNAPWLSTLDVTEMAAVSNLMDKQLGGYTFVSYGTVGDQPGQHQWHYLAPWRTLPAGTFVAAAKFAETPVQYYPITNYIYPGGTAQIGDRYDIYGFPTNQIPFPTETSKLQSLPCLAFNYLGQLTDDGVNMAGRAAYVPLERGGITYPRDPSTKMPVIPSSAMSGNDITESPPGNSTNSSYNVVEIDPLTGRATLHFQKLP